MESLQGENPKYRSPYLAEMEIRKRQYEEEKDSSSLGKQGTVKPGYWKDICHFFSFIRAFGDVYESLFRAFLGETLLLCRHGTIRKVHLSKL